MRLPSGLRGALEIGLNRYLAADPEALERCRNLHGRSLALHVRDFDLELFLLPTNHGIQLADVCAGEPDVRLSGGARAFANTLFSGDAAALTGGGLRIEGDVGLAQAFANMLRGVELDLEDWLGQRLGDVPAHLISSAVRNTGGFLRRAADNLFLDGAEYLREETRDLVHREEIAEWRRGVDTLRADTDRLTARLRRLKQETERTPE